MVGSFVHNGERQMRTQSYVGDDGDVDDVFSFLLVSVSIDHIICNVLRQPQVMESVVSLSTEFYLLKLHGRVEYLDSDSLLKVGQFVSC